MKSCRALFFSMLFFALLGAMSFSCTKHEHEESERTEINMSDPLDDVKLPVMIWDMADSGDGGASEAAKGSGGHGAPAAPPPAPDAHGGGAPAAAVGGGKDKNSTYTFSPIKVHLDQKNDGVLVKPSVSLQFARGGGSVDLSELVASQNGSFYLSFELSDEMKDSKDLKVFFISSAKKRKIGNEILGGGCQSLFDLSKKFEDNFIKSQLKLNTTRDRHLSVIGGSFVFSVKKDNQVYISQISFTDSKKKHLFCD